MKESLETMHPANPSEESLFVATLALNPSEREAFLLREYPEDPALRARVTALLEAHAALETEVTLPGELSLPIGEPEDWNDRINLTIGRYKLLEKLGEGGCGVVYVAEQTEPVRRRVALKVIKLGMDTKAVVARFEAERQALALMDHPNIAKVLDAGTTDQGKPYFVMELVRGIRITDYCDQNHLGTQDRLELFIKVCQAIQHAHQKGIIHRDIKPSNILVTLHDGVPVPKVIDFGIAKATEGKLTDATVYTQLHQFIGTPAYMSPEQAEMSGLDIDTRSDIYSLGVLLYELLAGSTPFDGRELMSQGIDAMRRTIREKEPQRPSTRLATLGPDQLTTTARRRSADTSRLLHQLKGDLDWIVMKCLEKDRQRRYETANGLAADLQRHLDNEPVTARPPSAAYKFQKTIRRNKLVFAASGAVAIGLLIGLAALTYALIRERSLKSESARADSIATFVAGLLNEAVPELLLKGDSAGIRVLVDSADRLVSTTLTNAPGAELRVRSGLAYFYTWFLADFRSVRRQTDRMEFLLPRVADSQLPPYYSRDDLRIDAAESRMLAGSVAQGQADLERLAEEFKQRGSSARRALARSLAKLGNCLRLRNRREEAELLLAEAYKLEPGRNGPGFYWEDFAGHPYAFLLLQNGRYREAAEVARTTVNEIQTELAGGGSRTANAALNANLGLFACWWLLVEAECRLGRTHEMKTLIEEQLGPKPAMAWTAAPLQTFKGLRLNLQAYSGEWREAALGFVALATNAQAGVWDWGKGAAAALSTGDTNTYARLCRWGRARYANKGEADIAHTLFWALALRPEEEDLSLILPDLLRRLEESQDYHWTAVHLPFLRSQLAYRNGEYEEALRSLDEWIRLKDDRALNASQLHTMRASPLPDFWRAMILARLGQAEGAAKAHRDGAEKLRAGFPMGDEQVDWVWYFYLSRTLQQESEDVLRSLGMSENPSALKP